MMDCGTDIPTAERKAEIRKKIRRMRREQDVTAAAEASALICKRVKALEEYKNAGVMLAYMAARGEVDVAEIVRDAVSSGKKAAFPLCVDNGGLRLLIPESPDSFVKGAYGILEPDLEKSNEIYPEELDLIIVPAVAYTECCSRLGQGGGYYDRLLTKTNACSIGVGFDFQLLPFIPTEVHDKPLDYVVLPSCVFKRAK